jgi:hypothetical protein
MVVENLVLQPFLGMPSRGSQTGHPIDDINGQAERIGLIIDRRGSVRRG